VQRTRVGGPYVSSPRWSPDGTRIAFVDAGRLRILDDATSTVTDPMTPDETGESRHPTWSPNGQELYYASNRTGAWQIMRIDLRSDTEVQVTSDGGTTARASADGQSLFFTNPHRAGLWRKHLASGEETLVLETLAPVDDLSWTLTPRAVFYVRRVEDRPMLHRFDLGDASDRQVGALPGLMTRSGLAVSSDERQVWFVRIDRQEADILMLERPRAAR
jgi:dipeptidyl aminopeptidase/acylaminoacyl peptidase